MPGVRVSPARLGRAAILFLTISAAAAASARAQVYIGRDIPRAGSVEVSGGATYSAGYDLGSVSAEETRNTGVGTGPFVLFSATSRAKPAAGVQGRIGVYLAPSVSVEGGVQFARPVISSRLSDDAESAADVTATETLTRIGFNGSLVLHLIGMSFAGGKGVPFVLGGGGAIRELHEKNEVVETGHEYHGGAGLHVWFGQGTHRAGIRGDFGVARRSGGAYASGVTRTVASAAGSVAFLF
jgi:hypothetical protein